MPESIVILPVLSRSLLDLGTFKLHQSHLGFLLLAIPILKKLFSCNT